MTFMNNWKVQLFIFSTAKSTQSFIARGVDLLVLALVLFTVLRRNLADHHQAVANVPERLESVLLQ